MAMTRVQFNQALREAASMEFADIPLDEEQISFSFSDKYIKKMEKLISCQRRLYWGYVNTTIKRVAIVVILFFSIILTVFSNDEVRASMLQWCADVYEEYIKYYFEGETTKIIEYEYQLTMIPKGFEISYEDKDEERCITEYENKEGDGISLYQHVTEEFEVYIDNENGEWSTEVIGTREVILADYKTQMSAMWTEDGYFMVLIYYGCDDMEIIKEMVGMIR